MSAESSAAIIRRMADADNAASMRRLERQLADALALLDDVRLAGLAAREEFEAIAPGLWRDIDIHLQRHRAPDTWRRGGAT